MNGPAVRRAAWFAAAIAACSAVPAAHASEPASLRRVQELAQRGAYADCLAKAEAALADASDDAWLSLYQSLCSRRLQDTGGFRSLSREDLHAMLEALQQEERDQRRAAAQQKALDQQLKQEQVQWDRQVKSLARDVERETLRANREAEQAARRRQRLTQIPAAPPSPATPTLPIPASEPALPPHTRQLRPGESASSSESEPAAPSGEVAGGLPETSPGTRPERPRVEPAPVHVEKEAAKAGGEIPVRAPVPTPSLVGRPEPPEGAVQINARQMSVSPDQKVATAEGDVELVYGDAFLTCDRMTLFTDTHDVYAEGKVRLEQGNQVFRGEMVHYNFDNKKGRFLQGTISTPPWVEHGRSLEHIAEGVYEVTPGYLTTCDLEPPHFRLAGRRAIVFAEDRHARASNVALLVEQMPFLYLPFVTFSDQHSPFFLIPGKQKPWGAYALGGYRYELPGEGQHRGTLRADWRQNYRWGYGLDHQFESPQAGKGLLRVYYNAKSNREEAGKTSLPKGADERRYRATWRHWWRPAENTTVLTDIEKFSDINFRKDFLFREEHLQDDQLDSYISSVTSTPDYSFAGLLRKRVNRFQTVNDALPQLTFDLRERQIGDTDLYTRTQLDGANFQTKRAHSDNDTDVIRASLLQQFKYAVRWFRPLELTPNVGTRQTYYTKDAQGSDRKGQRNLISGQFFTGADSSLKFSRVFPVATNAWGLNIHRLRHLVTPTVSYNYRHDPTHLSDTLVFPAEGAPTSVMTFGLEHKLQTKRLNELGTWQSVDLARLLTSLPYTFHGAGNEQGARFGNWTFDLESVPWPWLRLESDVLVPSHFDPRVRDSRIRSWNTDLVAIGGQGLHDAERAHDIVVPQPVAFQPGPSSSQVDFLPKGQWYLGLGHRYSANDKTESVLEWDWRLTEKWQIGTFHRYTFKEVVDSHKRFNNLREFQYNLRRDLHDWIGELVYRVDREYGEELFFTLTLKAFPEMPIQTDTSYHQPKVGSQSSVFSPVH